MGFEVTFTDHFGNERTATVRVSGGAGEAVSFVEANFKTSEDTEFTVRRER